MKIFVVGIILLGLGLVIGILTGALVLNEQVVNQVLLDPVQLQEYLNTNPTADPAFEPLEVDGRIGPKTIKAWEWVSAHQVELEMP